MFSIVKHGVPYNFIETGLTQTDKWLRDNFAIWEPFTFEVFEKVANAEKLAVDIGAWIGLTGIWLSKHFKHVIAVEADPKAVESLERNLNASGCKNVTIIPHPLFHKKQRVYFGPNKHVSGATLNDSMCQLKDNWTHPQDISMDALTLTDVLPEASQIGFIKCDIEGGEEVILEELVSFSKKHAIPLLLSFHIWWWREGNIRRFSSLFDTEKTQYFTDGFQSVVDPVSYLESTPMGTLFFRPI